jgi:hypothetical protein
MGWLRRSPQERAIRQEIRHLGQQLDGPGLPAEQAHQLDGRLDQAETELVEIHRAQWAARHPGRAANMCPPGLPQELTTGPEPCEDLDARPTAARAEYTDRTARQGPCGPGWGAAERDWEAEAG